MVAVLEVLCVVEAVQKIAHLAHELAEVLPRQRHLLYALYLRQTTTWFLEQRVEPVAQKSRHQGHQWALTEELRIARMHFVTLLDIALAFIGILSAQLRSKICRILQEGSRLARLLRIADSVNEVRVDENRVAR